MRFDFPSQGQISELLAIWKDAFGDHGGFWEMFLNTAFQPEHCRCVNMDGKIAAALYWFDCSCHGQTMAYVYAVITHPDYRNKGLCRKLFEDVHKHLTAHGYAAVLLVPEQKALRQMYRRLGYRDCTFVSEFSCTAGDRPVPMRAIGPEEYGKLRRAFLTTGGVVQEGENLRFLAAQAQFFTGEDFLLAAYVDGNILVGMELLGNRDAAPGILCTLNCAQGNFRIPGKEKAFAMIHPLTENALTPNYFGFAFD